MSELPHSAPGAYRQDTLRQPRTADRKLGSRLLWMTVIPVVTATLAATATVTYLLLRPANSSQVTTTIALSVAALVCVAVCIIAAVRAKALGSTLQDRIDDVRDSINDDQRELQHFLSQAYDGAPLRPDAPVTRQDEFSPIQYDLARLRHLVYNALSQPIPVQAQPAQSAPTASEHRVDVFVNLSRRLQSLVHREIQLLDELESQVEDPDLLKGLFAIDHLATRTRRHAENLAVLGGSTSRRQWSRPVNVHDILRSAVAEVEQYFRIKLIRPIEGNLQGRAVTDIIHLVAELAENATKFSAPDTQVFIRAQTVTAGLAIEVEDRGLGMPRDNMNRMNAMLSAPSQINLDELLQDGRIGLYVVAALARRHSAAVQLQTNIYGGIQAVLVLPMDLLGEEEQQAPRELTSAPAEPEPAHATTLPSREPVAPSAHHNGPQLGNPDPGSASPVVDPVFVTMQTPQQAYTAAPPPQYPVAGAAGATPPARPTPTAGTRAPSPRHGQQPSPTPIPRRPAPHPPATPDEARPQLPRRRQQAHLAPQLQDAPEEHAGGSTAEHDPGLMLAFQQGMNRGSQQPEEFDDQTNRPPTID